ncbi:hypothetical protein [Streptococcus halichoeri]|uniref:hypothetical protein n=1 Tax=Streptococcus halichoeri TaxID=254785 RepID=UPI00135C1A55|nr:hypothetical protein [Streptococcus halichoeri]
MLKKFFSEVNYRRVIFSVLTFCAFTGWLFGTDVFRLCAEYEMFFGVSMIALCVLIDENKDEILFIAILYVLIQPLSNYLITLFKITPSPLLAVAVILFSVSLRIDTIINVKVKGYHSKLQTEYFNLVYINSAKSYEIATLIDDTVKTSIQKEKSNVTSQKKSFKFGAKNTLQAGYENSNEQTIGSKISESFEVKSTKSTIFRKVYEMAKKFESGELVQGDLVKFDSVSLVPVNAQDIPLVLQVLQSSKIDNPSADGVELNMSNLLSTFLTDYTIDYSFELGNENFLVRLPYGEVEGFENGYRHSDFQLGKLNLVGIDRGEIDFSEIDTMSTKFLDFMSKQAKKTNTPKHIRDIIPKSSTPKSDSTDQSNSEFELDFNYNKLEGRYHLIDVIAVVQKINVGE